MTANRRPNDWYPTPAWCVDRLLEHPHIIGLLRRCAAGGVIVDPCAGDGSLLDAIARHHPDARMRGYDIAPQRDDIELRDTLAQPLDRHPRMAIVTNPPYSLAREFVEMATEAAPVSIMLLRLGFAASAARRDWLRELMPSLYILPNRPSFTGDGRTDSYDYAWFVFGGNLRGRVEWLRKTPAEERRGGPKTLMIPGG